MKRKKTIDLLYRTMPWDDIDTVVFDVGNVLIVSGFDDLFKENNIENSSELYNLTYKSPYWYMRDEGSITLEEATESMIGWREDLRKEIEFIMQHWMEYKHVKEEGVKVLEICKQHSKRLVVLSNYSDNGFSYLENKFSLFKDFEEIIVSSRIGMVKPHLEIFKYAEEKCKLDPSRTLFIDDKPSNCVAAMNAGWHAICANAPGKLAKFFM